MAAKKQKQSVEYDPPPPCAHDGCGYSSYLRIHTKTGWANVCQRHYDGHFQRQADAYCESLGLHTIEQKKQWLRDNKLIVKKVPVTREPGEDLDEAA